MEKGFFQNIPIRKIENSEGWNRKIRIFPKKIFFEFSHFNRLSLLDFLVLILQLFPLFGVSTVLFARVSKLRRSWSYLRFLGQISSRFWDSFRDIWFNLLEVLLAPSPISIILLKYFFKYLSNNNPLNSITA